MISLRPGVAARCAALGIWCVVLLSAQPPLTTIRDVLYKADGSRFNGYVQITWNSFEAGDTSNIATQFRAVRIVDGIFQVKLVPTTNADRPATYSVQYNSDGKVQFEETWAVPPSSKPLRVRDVRISTPSNLASAGGPLQESDVVGLVADLNARPTEGPGYATGRTLLSNSIGELEAVGGNLTDCVHVDGSSGPCGTPGVGGFIDSETPSGLVDGANASFGLASQPSPVSSLALYRNGILQKQSLDFTISGSTIQFLTASTPQPGDTLLASYRVTSTGSALTTSPSVETLCSSTGSATSSTAPTSLGQCIIPAGTVKSGDRIEIRFDYAHTGSLSGFAFQAQWGSTMIVQRTASSGDTQLTGWAQAAIDSAGAQLSAQSWGTVLALGTALAGATDSLSAPLTIDLLGNLAQPAGDSLTLRNFTVLRYSR